MLAAVLLLAVLVSKSCGSRESEVSKEEAIAIAREEVDYAPERVGVRFLPRGFQSLPTWAVSLALLDDAGELERVTVVVVNARTGAVEEVRRRG